MPAKQKSNAANDIAALLMVAIATLLKGGNVTPYS